MEDNFKNIIIIVLILGLIFIVYNKMNKTDKFFDIKPNESFTNGMLSVLNKSSASSSSPYSSSSPRASSSSPHSSSSSHSSSSPRASSSSPHASSSSPHASSSLMHSSSSPHASSSSPHASSSLMYSSSSPHASSSLMHSSSSPHASNDYHVSNNYHASNDHQLFDSNEWTHNHNYSHIMEPINSNVVNNNITMTNMGEHELIHMDTSKPYLINDEIPIENLLGCNNTIQLQHENFNYNKNPEHDIVGIDDLENEIYESI